MVQFSSVQWLSRVNSVTPWTPAGPGFPVHHQLLEFAPIYVHHVGAAIGTSYHKSVRVFLIPF